MSFNPQASDEPFVCDLGRTSVAGAGGTKPEALCYSLSFHAFFAWIEPCRGY